VSKTATAITRHDGAMLRSDPAIRLTPTQFKVMQGVRSGQLNKQIAFDLGIALKTVKVHRAKVMEKMRAGSVAGLVELCHAVRGD